ncbi:hypothetical protein HOLleu_03448 [Holothuria leucospilota]|uniref:Uncharacterized protein n=1 Tax=Holothuria leucospilota TaxID=206669 RepID=A0A9Q1CRM5_HOLLE|nr:hypothetical protein HOLleu_03448 [Holothuria leucospilota]
MASTSGETVRQKRKKIECGIHVSETASGKVTEFTEISKGKVHSCAKEWKNLGVELSEFAKKILTENEELNFDTTVYGYHRQCYMKFTDISKIARAKLKLGKAAEKLPSQTESEDIEECQQIDESESLSEGPAPKVLRSKHRPLKGHILPPVCLICQKDSYITHHHTKKRSKERLVECQTITAGSLQKAAEVRKDEKLLLHIRGQDLVALEAKYHKTCYQQYVRVISSKAREDETVGQRQYQKAYDIFCHDIIEERIVKNAEIFRLTKLLHIFKDYVRKFESLEVASYRTYSLQQRLRKTYPQLVFLRPARKNLSCLVFSDNLTAADVVEDLPIEEGDSSETSASDAGDNPIPSVKNPSPTSVRDLYMSAQNLKAAVNQRNFEPMEWPPTAAALNLASAEHIVPSKLYNFLAWVIGASEEPVIHSKVKVDDSVHHKLLSVSQDIMQLAVKGKKLMPKFLSLGMAVRHMTGSAQLIGLLNGLGHCSSHSTVIEHDTALAQQNLNSSDALPATIVPGEFLTLVWDNIDFGEETLTGKGTTHSTNGIAIQRGRHDPSQRQKVPLVRRKQRSMEVPPCSILPYFGAKKHGPEPFGVQIELVENVDIQKGACLIDFSFHLLKAEYGDSIPTWTGYNIILCPEVQKFLM